VGTRCADHATPSIRKSRHYFADRGGRSVGIVRLRTKATKFSFSLEVMDLRTDGVLVQLRDTFSLQPSSCSQANSLRHDRPWRAPYNCKGSRDWFNEYINVEPKLELIKIVAVERTRSVSSFDSG
jgi:hypothetical protein